MSSPAAIHIGKRTKPVSWPVRIYERFRNRGISLQSPFLLAVRLYWGWLSVDAAIAKRWRKRA